MHHVHMASRQRTLPLQSFRCLQLPSNDPMYAHWCAKNYNASLIPGNDCVMGALNERYDYFLGNSSSTEGG
jgi:hypothetical protein